MKFLSCLIFALLFTSCHYNQSKTQSSSVQTSTSSTSTNITTTIKESSVKTVTVIDQQYRLQVSASMNEYNMNTVYCKIDHQIVFVNSNDNHKEYDLCKNDQVRMMLVSHYGKINIKAVNEKTQKEYAIRRLLPEKNIEDKLFAYQLGKDFDNRGAQFDMSFSTSVWMEDVTNLSEQEIEDLNKMRAELNGLMSDILFNQSGNDSVSRLGTEEQKGRIDELEKMIQVIEEKKKGLVINEA